jgi:hypothetical protein
MCFQTRWAWGTEEPTALERNVAPRKTPSFWVLRVLVLIALSWMLLVVTILGGTIFPVLLGRFIVWSLQVPSWLVHDPICFVAGAFVISEGANVVKALRSRRGRGLRKAAHKIPVKALLKGE